MAQTDSAEDLLAAFQRVANSTAENASLTLSQLLSWFQNARIVGPDLSLEFIKQQFAQISTDRISFERFNCFLESLHLDRYYQDAKSLLRRAAWQDNEDDETGDSVIEDITEENLGVNSVDRILKEI